MSTPLPPAGSIPALTARRATSQKDTREDLLQHPSGRIGAPEDIARAALFLCDGRNGFVNGQTITVDGV